MIIGIDGNEANVKNRVGVGQFAYHIISWLHRIDTINKYIVYLKEPPLSDMPPMSLRWEYRVFGPSQMWTKVALPFNLYTQKEKLDVFYSPSHYSPQFSPFPTIPTIHDLGYLKFKNQFARKDLYQLINWTKASIKKAKHIITVSEFSKSELQKIYKIPENKITVAYNGVGEPPQIPEDSSQRILSKFNVKDPYFLYLGTLKPNKNIPFLINAYSKFIKTNVNKNIKLVIAGKKGWLFNDIFSSVKKLGVEKNVIFTDFISETEKWALYQNALAFVIPSTYEGFGIPALEAMKVGTPVIASSIPPLKEVVENAGILIDPSNEDNLAQQLSLISDNKLSSKYSELGKKQAQKFTWEQSATKILNTFQSLAN